MSDQDSEHELAARPQDAVAIQVAGRALTLWESFPTGDPRPIVLIHGPVLLCQGFDTAEAKRAMQYGVVAADETVALEPLETIRTHSSDQTNQRMPKDPLWIESATLMETTFSTDRGLALLPAWKIEAVNAIGPIWVLEAQPLACCWLGHLAPKGQQQGPHILNSARIRVDECELEMEFIGGSERLFRYESAVVESSTAVSVVPLARLVKDLPHGTAIAAQGFRREIVVRLSSPLGSRVLVNHDGSPVEVVVTT
jgi:hypothetical protein